MRSSLDVKPLACLTLAEVFHLPAVFTQTGFTAKLAKLKHA